MNSEDLEEYYHLIKEIFEVAVKENKVDDFDGSLLQEHMSKRNNCAKEMVISSTSQALIDYLILVEWCLENNEIEKYELAIYNSLLKIEFWLKSSTWIIIGLETEEEEEKEDEVEGAEGITDFEFNLMEQLMSAYINKILCEEPTETWFFPERKDALRWRILQRIDNVKIVSDETMYACKLRNYLQKRFKNELEDWLHQLLSTISLGSRSKILDDLTKLTQVVEELNNVLKTDMVNLLDKLFDTSSYWNVIAEVLDETLYPVCNGATELLGTYQVLYKDYHADMKQSSSLCYRLYLELLSVVDLVAPQLKTESSLGRFKDICCLFEKAFLNILNVLEVECHSTIERLTELSETEHILENKIYNSTIIALQCIHEVIQESAKLKIQEEDLQLTFLIKTTEIVCDSANLFAKSLQERAASLCSNSKGPDYLESICALGNSVLHVMRFISKLPDKMQWSSPLEESERDMASCKKKVLPVLDHLQQTAEVDLLKTAEIIYNMAVLKVYSFCEKFLDSWLGDNILQPTAHENVERFLAYLNEELQPVYDSLQERRFQWFLGQLWLHILQKIEHDFQEGNPPEYAKIIKTNLELMLQYFTQHEADITETKPLYEEIHQSVTLNSKSTIELQLDYYGHLADITDSPAEFLGYIVFRAGYKRSTRNIVEIQIKILVCKKLPLQNTLKTIQARIELFPKVIFPSLQRQKTRRVLMDDPVFNQSFYFKLPLSALSVVGAVMQVRVTSQEADYCTEAKLRLNNIQDMSRLTSIDFLPVHIIALRLPDYTHPIYRVLKERKKKKDQHAKDFISGVHPKTTISGNLLSSLTL